MLDPTTCSTSRYACNVILCYGTLQKKFAWLKRTISEDMIAHIPFNIRVLYRLIAMPTFTA